MKKLQLNTILFTKDGTKVGNGIITKVINNNKYVVLTDYGNYLNLTSDEISELFITDEDINEDFAVVEYRRYTHKNAKL